MGMNLDMKVTDERMTVGGDFDTPVLNTAAFGQIKVNDLFIEGLDLTAGLRLDYEHTKMKYNSGATSNFNFLMTRNVQGRPIPLYNYDLTTDSHYTGTIKKDYTQLLPKVALTYNIDRQNMVYASVSKGFRSGGYNIQMFSDLIQASLQNDMMRTLAEKMPMVSNFMPLKDNPSADSTTVFKPETSWNYEVGTHLTFLNGHLTTDAAVFFVDTRDQQIARYAASGLGRQMVNAGHSQSYGIDLSATAFMYLFNNPLTINASYGYTHATFKDYDGGENKGESYVYDGNYVPFAPLHNFAVAADYTINFNDNLNGNHNGNSLGMRSISFGANLTGAGRTYWTEKNDVSQPLYTLLGAHITADFGLLRLNLWGKNLTQTDYVPFYFESMGNAFLQRARGASVGVRVNLDI
jgi:outer membrane receptor protein involved in Fe transport